jgi:hypothetical protein
MSKTSIIFFVLAIASLVLAIVSGLDNDSNGIITGLIGIYGNLILAKLHKKD